MRKKTIGALAVAAVATLSLASCGENSGPAEAVNGNVNIYLNYQSTSGVTFRESEAWTSPVDNKTYTVGALLPTWDAFAKNTGLSITDVASYTDSNDNSTYSTVSGANFLTADGSGIDLFYNTTSNINTMGSAGNALDLYQYILEGKMPNFAQYLSENPEVLETISVKGQNGADHIYYTPYFDGYQSIERMFVMDTQMVTRLFSAPAGDTTVAIDNENRLKGNAYTPYIVTEDGEYNFAANTKAVVATGALAANNVERDIVRTRNIIVQQNERLSGTNATTTTGADLLTQLKSYLTTAYPDYSSRLADIFIGQDAIYNADDLIALMRVVRANPVTATGVEGTTSIETLFPRGQAANRMENIYDFAQIWGLQGVDGESGNFYFDGAGKLVNNQSTKAAYDALLKLNELYSEGLIEANFYNRPSSGSSGTRYTTDYFANTTNVSTSYTGTKQGFMVYDYSASTTTGNDLDAANLGTDPANRKGIYAGLSKTGIRPVVAPLSYWNVSGETNPSANLTDTAGKTYMRYMESNRALKNTSWCIPKTATNIDGALRLMDYMFTAEGTRINDFGPLEYQGNTSATLVSNQLVPTLSSAILADMKTKTLDFWNYMRRYLGATNGFGHVREDSLNLQATNASAQVGQNYLDNAIRSGVVQLAKVVQSSDYAFGACVPTSWNISIGASDSGKYENLTNFWSASGTGNSQWRAIVVGGTGAYSSINEASNVTFATVLGEISDFNNYYARSYAAALTSGSHTPTWINSGTGWVANYIAA